MASEGRDDPHRERPAHPGPEAAALEVVGVHGGAAEEFDREVVEGNDREPRDAVDGRKARGSRAPLREAPQQQIGEVDEPEQSVTVNLGSHAHQCPQVPLAQIGPLTSPSVQKRTPTSAPATATRSKRSSFFQR